MNFKVGDKAIYFRKTPITSLKWIKRMGKTCRILQIFNTDEANVIFDEERVATDVLLKNLQLVEKRGHHLTKIFK